MGMFHTGDLQSGISLAIQQQKLVACFVRQDDDEASDTWEREWLANDDSPDDDTSGTSLATTIQEKAVLLRIDSGSQEASFLSAFCPIETSPTIVIIQNGTVLEKLSNPIERDEWTDRLLKALGARQPDPEPAAMANASVLQNHEQQTSATDDATAGSPSPTSQPPAAVQSLLAERGQRLELTRLRREAQEKQDRLARQRALREEAEASSQPSDKSKGKQRATSPTASAAPDEQGAARHKARVDWVQQQAKRKREATEEKERIRAQIEADKLERRRREEERKNAASSMAASPFPPTSSAPPAAASKSKPSSSSALQVRLFDGSAIKSRFAPSATLGTSVRTWISEASPPGQGGADIPYNFRLLQTPSPSRTIGDSEEEQALSEIGLGSGGTLVLVPVQGYTEAYSGSTGVVGSAVGLVSGALGWVGSGLSYVTGFGGSGTGSRGDSAGGGLYMGGTSDEGEESNVRGARMAGAETGTGDGSVKIGGTGGSRMKTLADKRAEDGEERREFYNGNSLGFEPRRDEDGDGDGEEGKGRWGRGDE